MNVVISEDKEQMGAEAAKQAAEVIATALRQRGQANIVVATGASQFTVLANLVAHTEIDWPRVTGFHLDEYLGIPMTHPASFRKYLKERLVDHDHLRRVGVIARSERPPAYETDSHRLEVAGRRDPDLRRRPT